MLLWLYFGYTIKIDLSLWEVLWKFKLKLTAVADNHNPAIFEGEYLLNPSYFLTRNTCAIQ